ncbi:hypothetical protein ASD83_14825 [Devosia sp. Root685]|nr:hypothetical protein ASD83_14825 [Devosia sp. Root685]
MLNALGDGAQCRSDPFTLGVKFRFPASLVINEKVQIVLQPKHSALMMQPGVPWQLTGLFVQNQTDRSPPHLDQFITDGQ